MKEELKQVAEAYGWEEVESKNPIMYSYINPENNSMRINYYYTSGTLTLQGVSGCETIRDSKIEDFEYMLKKGNDNN